MSNSIFDEYGFPAEEQRQGEAREETEVEALRRELADLREVVSGAMDAGEEINVERNRRLLWERGERDARAAAAASDPATLEKLRRIDNPEDLERFLKDNGGNM